MVHVNKTFFDEFIDSANTMLQHSALSIFDTCPYNAAVIGNNEFYLPEYEADLSDDTLITIPIFAAQISVYDAAQLTKAIEGCVFEIDGCMLNITATAGSLTKFIKSWE